MESPCSLNVNHNVSLSDSAATVQTQCHCVTHAKPGTLTKAKKNGSKSAVANVAATVRDHHQKYLQLSWGGIWVTWVIIPSHGAFAGSRGASTHMHTDTGIRACGAHMFESG